MTRGRCAEGAAFGIVGPTACSGPRHLRLERSPRAGALVQAAVEEFKPRAASTV
jgi:hypothetical protein